MSRCSTLLRSGSAHGSRLGSARLANASPFYSHSALTRETAPPPLADGLALLGTAAGRRSSLAAPPTPETAEHARRRSNASEGGRAPEDGRERPKVAERARARLRPSRRVSSKICFASSKVVTRYVVMCAYLSRFRVFNIVYFTVAIMELRCTMASICGQLCRATDAGPTTFGGKYSKHICREIQIPFFEVNGSFDYY